MSRLPAHQHGIALITAILVVALATIAATAALSSSRVALHRAENLRDSETEWWYATGVEAWIKSILARDAQDNDTDSLKDVWAKPVDYLPVDYGSIRGAIIDQQGLFNLNNLGTTDTSTDKSYSHYVKHLERILQGIEGADIAAARPLAAAIHDWIDADDQPAGLDGAEDTEYLSRTPPYRAANRYLESVSEVLAIRGMTPKLYRQLLPYITVLPRLRTPINVNTAPGPVLLAMTAQPSAELLRFVEERVQNPAKTPQEVERLFTADSPPVSVSSEFFLLRAEIFIGSGRLALYSFYYRPAQGAPVVLGRSLDSP